MMEYKGYVGIVEFDGKAKIFHGEVINTRDIITFQGQTVAEIEKAFQGSIDDYISWCEQDGVNPEKPYSGKFNLRLSPELHREVAITAKRLKLSINSFVEKVLLDEINMQSIDVRRSYYSSTCTARNKRWDSTMIPDIILHISDSNQKHLKSCPLR